MFLFLQFEILICKKLLRFDKGVCGSAAKNSRTELIKDVHKFPGHVACDAESQSELVVPIIFEVKIFILE